MTPSARRRNRPVRWRELSDGEDVCAAIESERPRLLVINASLLPEQAFKVAEAQKAGPGQNLALVAIVAAGSGMAGHLPGRVSRHGRAGHSLYPGKMP